MGFADLGARVDGGFGEPVRRLHVDRLGSCDARVAPVEDRYLEAEFEAALPGLRRLLGGGGTEFQGVDEPRRPGEPQRFGERLDRALRGLHVEALPHRGRFEFRGLGHGGGEVRQALGQLERELVSEEPHQSAQPLALGERRLPCARELRGGLGIEHLLARERDFRNVADARHAPRQFRRRLGGFLDLLQVAHGLLCRDRLDPRPARLQSHPYGGARDRELHLLEPPPFEPRAKRDGQQVDDREGQRPLELALVSVPRAQIGEMRVGHAPRLDEVGLGDAEFRVGRLQPAVVEQRHLNGDIGRQRIGEQPLHVRTDAVGIRFRFHPAHVLAETFFGGRLDARKTAVGRKRRAAAEEQRSERDRNRGSVHLCPPCSARGGVFASGLGPAPDGAAWPACPPDRPTSSFASRQRAGPSSL